jgi:DNA-binding beta-propeller fold protein YncE
VDLSSSRIELRRPVGEDPVAVALSPGGSTAYVVDAFLPVVDVVDTATGSIISNLSIATPPPTHFPAPTT